MKRVTTSTVAALALSTTLSLSADLLIITDRDTGHALDAYHPVAFYANKAATEL